MMELFNQSEITLSSWHSPRTPRGLLVEIWWTRGGTRKPCENHVIVDIYFIDFPFHKTHLEYDVGYFDKEKSFRYEEIIVYFSSEVDHWTLDFCKPAVI